jgi:hypothetical protein
MAALLSVRLGWPSLWWQKAPPKPNAEGPESQNPGYGRKRRTPGQQLLHSAPLAALQCRPYL